MIAVVSAEAALRASRVSLGLPEVPLGGEAEDSFLSAVVRRVAGLRAPCSGLTLSSATRECLRDILTNDDLAARVEDIVDALVANGDLLELSAVTALDDSLPKTALFVAPPSFVQTSNGTSLLLGMGEEESLPLPEELRVRVRYAGVRRLIEQEPGEDLRQRLLAYGYREQSLEGWLRQPRVVSAKEHLEYANRLLVKQRSIGVVDGLLIFNDQAATASYVHRWVAPATHSGRFIARRQQAYGAALWCYVELDNGNVLHLLDLPMANEAFRGCDAAWRLLLAREWEQGHAQRYVVRHEGPADELDLYFPIPMWAQRRMELVGVRVKRRHCLLTYRMPKDAAEEVAAFLERSLWLRRG